MEQPRVVHSVLMTIRSGHDPDSRKVARGVLLMTILARSANEQRLKLTHNRKALCYGYVIGQIEIWGTS